MKQPRPKTPSDLSVANQRRLSTYASAAAAAGVGILALATPSEGEVVYTPTHLKLPALHGGVPRYKLDLNGDGIADFELINSTTGLGRFGHVFVAGADRNHVVGAGFYASDLVPGATIGPDSPFANGSHGKTLMENWLNNSGTILSFGPWTNARDRYLGFRFLISGEYHFGWARLAVSGYIVKLEGYAYETVANQPINAGQESGSADDATNIFPTNSAIPVATATLGRLAQGAAGLAAWRREAEE